ncbi:hypothetical protein [Thermogymnomonas acidicola]|uniref:FAD-linked oxidase C-terminal domain-containing protein n=1 Tax=Thermogymnomonas acidicola TaxID=399579 RepID=UPI0009461307|nr:FAD-linked oxidase C-terminal domain-containing protein [Thermogymnomonas acidicola]
MSGVVPDTLETSADWDRLPGLYHGVREAFGNACSAEGIRGIIMAHVSHLYTSGACMYFTFLLQGPPGSGAARGGAQQRGQGLPQTWRLTNPPPRDR